MLSNNWKLLATYTGWKLIWACAEYEWLIKWKGRVLRQTTEARRPERRSEWVCSQDILVIFQISTPDQRAAQQGYGEGQSVGRKYTTAHSHSVTTETVRVSYARKEQNNDCLRLANKAAIFILLLLFFKSVLNRHTQTHKTGGWFRLERVKF